VFPLHEKPGKIVSKAHSALIVPLNCMQQRISCFVVLLSVYFTQFIKWKTSSAIPRLVCLMTNDPLLILSTSFSLKSTCNEDSEGRTITKSGVNIPQHSTSAGPPSAGSEPSESSFFGLPSKGGPASGKDSKQIRQHSTQNGSWLQVSTQVTA
jgi:hypothetical protein